MPEAVFETRLPTSPDELFTWHARPGAFERLVPPWQTLELERAAPLAEGSVAHLRLRRGPLRLRWLARHRDVVPGRSFVDEQLAGPFHRWVHHHEFVAEGPGAILRDRIDYRLPGGVLGAALGGGMVARDLSSTFAYRHVTTARDLDRHAALASSGPATIAVTGSTGLVGSQLVPFLTTGGHRVLRLQRSPSAAPDGLLWSPVSGLASPADLPPVDAIVHLAGESLAAGRWTDARKKEIRDSRVTGTRNLVRSLAPMDPRPRTLVCASAIGLYGSRGVETLTEESPPGEGFLAQVCRDWEAAATEARTLGIRVVCLRFGIVLTPAGGALRRMLLPFRLGLGGRLGSGAQIMSWISIDDLLGVIHRALFDEALSGPVNATTPNPVTQLDFARTLGRVLGRPTIAPLPASAARAFFGELADETLLASTRALPSRLRQEGFRFDDPRLEEALRRLLGRRQFS